MEKKTLNDVKKQNALIARLKIIAFAISILAGFITFLILYYTDSKIGSFSVGFTVLFLLFGICYLIIGACSKDFFAYILGSVSLAVGTLILLIAVINGIKWFIGVISTLVLLTILILVLFMFVAPKLQVTAKNEDPEYKNYKERREEQSNEKVEEEPLPELKSFKEEN